MASLVKMVSLVEYMNEENYINRWKIFRVGIVGVFCGAVLTVVFMWGVTLI